MSRRLVLHIGAMKSGTTFVQNVLATNAGILAERGILWPGRTWYDQVRAVLELIERGSRGQQPIAPDGPWRSLVDEIDAWDGDAIVSMEFLGPRGGRKIDQVLAAFGDTEVEVVLTARDLPRQLPAMWQESVQNGGQHSWPEYVAAVRRYPGVRSKPGRSFWKQQSVDETVRRWSDRVGRDRLTVVTVPPPGGPPGLLWERFAQATGLPVTDLPTDSQRGNTSIGTASAMVLRDLNRSLERFDVAKPDYDVIVKYGLAKAELAGRDEAKVGCDEPWLRKRARRQLDGLRALDPRVVGDLDDLEPHPVPGADFADLTLESRLEAATDALAHMVRVSADQRQELKRLRGRIRQRRAERRAPDEPDRVG